MNLSSHVDKIDRRVCHFCHFCQTVFYFADNIVKLTKYNMNHSNLLDRSLGAPTEKLNKSLGAPTNHSELQQKYWRNWVLPQIWQTKLENIWPILSQSPRNCVSSQASRRGNNSNTQRKMNTKVSKMSNFTVGQVELFVVELTGLLEKHFVFSPPWRSAKPHQKSSNSKQKTYEKKFSSEVALRDLFDSSWRK